MLLQQAIRSCGRRRLCCCFFTSTPQEPSERILRNRPLDDEKIYNHNSWDVMEWSQQELTEAEGITALQRLLPMPADKASSIFKWRIDNWNRFYIRHKNRFFANRNWICHETAELIAKVKAEKAIGGTLIFLEAGCGVGNTVYPLLDHYPAARIHAFDFSGAAVNQLERDERFDRGRINSFVFDMSEADEKPLTDYIAAHSVDVVFLIYALSAMEPRRHGIVFKKLASILRPGGVIFFRDYGLYDQSQLQFPSGRCIQDRLYARGDGTLVHFFNEDDIKNAVAESGDIYLVVENCCTKKTLMVNRRKNALMRRSFVQGVIRWNT